MLFIKRQRTTLSIEVTSDISLIFSKKNLPTVSTLTYLIDIITKMQCSAETYPSY